MKKVLALVLAVVMVCTMAMAIQVGGNSVTQPGQTEKGIAVNPGTRIAITQKDLDDWDITYLTDDSGKLVPQTKNADGKVIKKSTVNVSFGTGSALVASQGWVETADGWQYQIILKENDAMKLDEKVDLSFSQISYKNTGDLKAQVVKFNDADKTAGTADDKILFDVGYVVVEAALDENDVLDLDNITEYVPDDVLATDGINRGYIVKVLKGESKTGSGKAVITGTGSTPWVGEIPVKAGETIFVSEAIDKDWNEKEVAKYDQVVGIDGNNPTAKPASVKVGNYNLLGWSKDTNIYAKNFRTGALVKLTVTLDDGVASFTVPALSQVASFTGTLAGATTETTTTPGSTTNPGTGANDVVGVAAALAVVALVSGAAISLKK